MICYDFPPSEWISRDCDLTTVLALDGISESALIRLFVGNALRYVYVFRELAVCCRNFHKKKNFRYLRISTKREH